MKRWLLLFLAGLIAGCDSEIRGVRSFPSPDGRHDLQVITELQGANDPTPWSQHIALRKSGAGASTQCSIARFVGLEPLEVMWTSSAAVRVLVPPQLLQHSKIPSGVTRDGVFIDFHPKSQPSGTSTPNQTLERTDSAE